MNREAESDDLPDAEDDLHATSESIQDDAGRVQALEVEKVSLDPADPRVKELTHEIEQLTRNMAQKAAAESALIDEIRERDET